MHAREQSLVASLGYLAGYNPRLLAQGTQIGKYADSLLFLTLILEVARSEGLDCESLWNEN